MKTLLSLAAATLTVLTLLAFTASQRADSGERTDCSPAFVIQNPDLRAAFADRDRQRNPEWNELCGRIRAATAGESRNSL